MIQPSLGSRRMLKEMPAGSESLVERRDRTRQHWVFVNLVLDPRPHCFPSSHV